VISAVVLAAGESSRFNAKIKALLKINETTFIEKIIQDLLSTEVSELIVVFGAHFGEIINHINIPGFEELKPVLSDSRDRYNLNNNIKLILNRRWKKGQLSSLREGIKNLSPESEGVLFTLVDHPLVERKTYNTLISTWKENPHCIVIPTFMGRKGHPAIFPQRLYSSLLEEQLAGGARDLIYREIDSVLFVPISDRGVITDIDTMEDYKTIIRNN